ncbi:MAG: glycosyltransferase, partial [Planctomycetota bacterium]
HDVNQLPLQKPKNYYDELFKYCDSFIANTEFTKRQTVNLGCDSDKIAVIPVSLHVKDFPFKPRVLCENETVQILTVGRLVEKKGYQFSIGAVAQLIKDGFNIHYTIAGGGPLLNDLEKMVHDFGIENHVTFSGEVTQEDVVQLYNRSHLFVLSSVTAKSGDKEGQALVNQEAQACGLPVVSTLHNGIPDGVLDGQSGLLVPEKDVTALTEAVKKLLGSPSLWPEMGRKGRQFVENKYDTNMITSQLICLYNDTKKAPH